MASSIQASMDELKISWEVWRRRDDKPMAEWFLSSFRFTGKVPDPIELADGYLGLSTAGYM